MFFSGRRRLFLWAGGLVLWLVLGGVLLALSAFGGRASGAGAPAVFFCPGEMGPAARQPYLRLFEQVGPVVVCEDPLQALTQARQQAGGNGIPVLAAWGHQVQPLLDAAGEMPMVLLSPSFQEEPLTAEVPVQGAPLLICGESIGGAATPAEMTGLYNILAGDCLSPAGSGFHAARNAVQLVIGPGIPSAPALPSGEQLQAIAAFLQPFGSTAPLQVPRAHLWIPAAGWCFLLLGLVLLGEIGRLCGQLYLSQGTSVRTVQVHSPLRFGFFRVGMWGIGLLGGGALWLAVRGIASPLALPGQLAGCYLAVYGGAGCALYLRGKMPGASGRPGGTFGQVRPVHWAGAAGIFLTAGGACWVMQCCSFFPWSLTAGKLAWAAALLLPCCGWMLSLGFDRQVAQQQGRQPLGALVLQLLSLAPLGLLPAFFIPMGQPAWLSLIHI